VDEECGNGTDDNCDGQVDEWCWLGPSGGGGPPPGPDGPKPPPPPPPPKRGTAGCDPILIATRSAATEPFTDFSVTATTALSIVRSYSSADASVLGTGAPGLFGRGWHHAWEARVTCDGEVCTLVRGTAAGLRFGLSGTALSPDGAEEWEIYGAYGDAAIRYDAPGALVRRPGGEWIHFAPDGSEQRFATVCDACGPADAGAPRCLDARDGGWARLVRAADAAGNGVTVSYDRPGGLLLGLRDDLGHELELRGEDACWVERAGELRYDGDAVAFYGYDGEDLVSVTDRDGSVLRGYVYVPGSEGRLVAVLDEAGTSVTEFAYDALWRATGIVDAGSDVQVDYEAPGGVGMTEHFQGPGGPTASTSVRALDASGAVTSVSDGCSCGPPATFTWTDRRLTCSVDAEGMAEGRVYDGDGRMTRRVRYAGSCPLPAVIPAPFEEQGWEYGLTRWVAQGVALPLDGVTRTWRRSAWTGTFEEVFDRDPAPESYDPPGYACQEGALPAGSAVCRRVEKGYAFRPNVVVERHATFYSYDARGRLVRTIGPVNLDFPSASDVTPLEERSYWPEWETLARRGRLRELRRYPLPNGAPLVTSYDYDAFGVYQVKAPDGALTTFVKDGRGRIRFTLSAAGVRETRYHDGERPRLTLEPTGAALGGPGGARGDAEGALVGGAGVRRGGERDPDDAAGLRRGGGLGAGAGLRRAAARGPGGAPGGRSAAAHVELVGDGPARGDDGRGGAGHAVHV
jgi:hypothetical protein